MPGQNRPLHRLLRPLRAPSWACCSRERAQDCERSSDLWRTRMKDLSTSIIIRAPREQVWKAVTTPAVIKQWFFGVDTDSDFNVGSPLVHRGTWQGKTYEDKGEILESTPP